jgi:glycosyltransferase involved in cell wall biosynthesis
MNILHLNTYSLSKNKSFPHFNFHRDLLEDGHDSIIVSAKGDIVDDKIIILEHSKILPFIFSAITRKFFFQILNKNDSNYYYPEWNLDNIKLADIINRVSFTPDVIITYWTKFAFNQKIIFELSEYYDAPVLTLPVDMASFTGGCHFSGSCDKYKKSCGSCHVLNSTRDNDLSRRTLLFKKKYIDKTDLTMLVCSSVISRQLSSSSLTKDIDQVPMLYTVDETIFYPKGKAKARIHFKIPNNKKVIFFGAANLNHPRKGMIYLIEALNILSSYSKESYSNKDIVLLIAGNKLEIQDIPFDYVSLGYLEHEHELASAYRACDVFACPSIEDAGPLMINQSIMSGRPVVAFNMGVDPDLVLNGKTGYVADIKDSRDFSIGLHTILSMSESEWKVSSFKCRELGLSRFSRRVNRIRLTEILSNLVKRKNKNL